MAFVMCFDVNASMLNNVDFYSPSFAKNYIPVLVTNRDEYSIAVLSNIALAKFVNAAFIKSKNSVGSEAFRAEYKMYLNKNLRSGYLHIDANKIIEYLGLTAQKNLDSVFVRKFKKEALSDQGMRIEDCFTFKDNVGFLNESCVKYSDNAKLKFHLFSRGYLVKELDLLPIIVITER